MWLEMWPHVGSWARFGSVPSGHLAAAVCDQLNEAKFGQPRDHLVEIRGLLAPGQAHDGLATKAIRPGGRQGWPREKKTRAIRQPLWHPDE